jgi:capsular polysaccharide biosynthesis protein
LVDSHSVTKETVRRLNLPRGAANELLNNLTVQYEDALFIGLVYTDSDPKRAQQIVNTVGRLYTERITSEATSTQKMHLDTELTATLDEASLPLKPVSPKPLRNGLITLVVGLTLLLAWALVRRASWSS